MRIELPNFINVSTLMKEWNTDEKPTWYTVGYTIYDFRKSPTKYSLYFQFKVIKDYESCGELLEKINSIDNKYIDNAVKNSKGWKENVNDLRTRLAENNSTVYEQKYRLFVLKDSYRRQLRILDVLFYSEHKTLSSDEIELLQLYLLESPELIGKGCLIVNEKDTVTVEDCGSVDSLLNILSNDNKTNKTVSTNSTTETKEVAKPESKPIEDAKIVNTEVKNEVKKEEDKINNSSTNDLILISEITKLNKQMRLVSKALQDLNKRLEKLENDRLIPVSAETSLDFNNPEAMYNRAKDIIEEYRQLKHFLPMFTKLSELID